MTEIKADTLSNKIWHTRKARIHASQRLYRWDTVSQLSVAYYTLIILGLSVWSLTIPPDEHKSVPLLTVIASVALFGMSIYVSSMKFRERANVVKDCYIELDALQMEIDLLRDRTEQSIEQDLIRLQKEYNRILKTTENHSEYDHIFATRNAGKPLDSVSWSRLVFYYLCIIVGSVLLFGAPLLLIYLVAIGVF